MSAETLRRAASLMREHVKTEVILRDGDPYYETTVMPDGSIVGEQGQFERHWSPAVALAVADWLEVVALTWGHLENAGIYGVRINALAVARAYLGEPA